jgi:TonB-dependent SusC/RagA subfamily outer membrane receptor
VSNDPLSPRALVALVAVSLATSLGCASGGSKNTAPPPSSADAAYVGNNEGKSTEDLFSGRFPGVIVTRTSSGGLQIRIRGGSNTFYGSNEPLFVLDETPIPPGSGGIVYVNPHDIQTIQVLKNPADIALYGIRGANGVVKITTKRPGR